MDNLRAKDMDEETFTKAMTHFQGNFGGKGYGDILKDLMLDLQELERA